MHTLTKEKLKHVFVAESGTRKLIDCIQVDGASDEGPSLFITGKLLFLLLYIHVVVALVF